MLFRVLVIIRQIKILDKYPTSREFIKFCLVGFTNLVVDLLVYSILTRWFFIYYLLASVLSFGVAVTWSFYINRRWTFRNYNEVVSGQYIKFFIVNLVTLCVSLAGLYTLVDVVGINDLLAKLSMAVVGAFFNFSLNKLWTFKGGIT